MTSLTIWIVRLATMPGNIFFGENNGSYLGRNSDACAGNIYLSADRWWDYYGEHVDLSSPTDE